MGQFWRGVSDNKMKSSSTFLLVSISLVMGEADPWSTGYTAIGYGGYGGYGGYAGYGGDGLGYGGYGGYGYGGYGGGLGSEATLPWDTLCLLTLPWATPPATQGDMDFTTDTEATVDSTEAATMAKQIINSSHSIQFYKEVELT